MTRLLVLLALIAGCSNDEPPPDPLGACAKARVIFEKVDAGLTAVIAHAPDVPVDVYCGKVQGAVKTANMVALALVGMGAKGDGRTAAAASAVREHTKELITGAQGAVQRCTEEGIPATQKLLQAQLAKARAGVEKTCSK